MNYKKNYYDYIEYVKTLNRYKQSEVYYEKHHILPRSLGGADEKNNLVLLTGREHFLAHYLLCKIYEFDGNKYFKMLRAFMCMKTGNGRLLYNSRLYSLKKQAFRSKCSENMMGKRLLPIGYRHSEETKQKQRLKRKGRKPNLGKKHTEETKHQIAETQKLKIKMFNYELQKQIKVLPEEVEYYKDKGFIPHRDRHKTEKEKQFVSKQFKGVPKSKEHREKIGNAHRGRPKSEEHIRKMSEAQKGKKTSKETKEKLSLAHQNTVWINNKIISKMIKQENLEEFLTNGWERGRLTNNKVYINKNKVIKLIDINMLDVFIEEGWKKGRVWGIKD
jgi:hypothetical protein